MAEVADHLNLPDRLVAEVCTELLHDGELRIDAGALQRR